MNLSMPLWYQPDDIEGVAVSETWEPDQQVCIRSISMELDAAATTDEDISAVIKNAAGDVIYTFTPINPLALTPRTSFTMPPLDRESAIVPSGGSLVVAFLNTDDIDPVTIVVGYNNVEQV